MVCSAGHSYVPTRRDPMTVRGPAARWSDTGPFSPRGQRQQSRHRSDNWGQVGDCQESPLLWALPPDPGSRVPRPKARPGKFSRDAPVETGAREQQRHRFGQNPLLPPSHAWMQRLRDLSKKENRASPRKNNSCHSCMFFTAGKGTPGCHFAESDTAPMTLFHK